MAKITKFLIFQIGYNWKGDPSKPLFEKGLKSEVVDWIESQMVGNWGVFSVLVAQKTSNFVVYTPMNPHNIMRQDELGEFLYRPIFFEKSVNIAQRLRQGPSIIRIGRLFVVEGISLIELQRGRFIC